MLLSLFKTAEICIERVYNEEWVWDSQKVVADDDDARNNTMNMH